MQSNEPALDLITQGVTLMKLQKYSDACDMFRLLSNRIQKTLMPIFIWEMLMLI